MFCYTKINMKNSSDKGIHFVVGRTLLDASMVFHFHEMFLKVNF